MRIIGLIILIVCLSAILMLSTIAAIASITSWKACGINAFPVIFALYSVTGILTVPVWEMINDLKQL